MSIQMGVHKNNILKGVYSMNCSGHSNNMQGSINYIDESLKEQLLQYGISKNDSLSLKWIGNLYLDEMELKNNEDMGMCLDDEGNINYLSLVSNFNKLLDEGLNAPDCKLYMSNGLFTHKDSLYSLRPCNILGLYGSADDPANLIKLMDTITEIDGIHTFKTELIGDDVLRDEIFQIPNGYIPNDMAPRWTIADKHNHAKLRDTTIDVSLALEKINTIFRNLEKLSRT